MVKIFETMWSIIPSAPEFWSAIVGAVVGGGIAYIIQMRALREGRKQRDDDRKQLQQALGNALIFKMIRIHTNSYSIHRHIEDCFAEAASKKFNAEPWQFFQRLTSLPDPVHFSSDEMGMLLALKNDEVFNLVLPMDVIHNSLIDTVNVLNTERKNLTQQLKANDVAGAVVSSILDADQVQALRPRMIEVNILIEAIRDRANRDFEESGVALNRLHEVLQEKLVVTYNLVSKVKPKEPPSDGIGGASS